MTPPALAGALAAPPAAPPALLAAPSRAAAPVRAGAPPARPGRARGAAGQGGAGCAAALLAALGARRPRRRAPRAAALPAAEAPGAGGPGRRAALLAALALGAARPGPARCEEAEGAKRRNLAPQELAEIVERDVSERAFMVSADLTRSVYDEKCTFTDEIDTYEIDKFIKGTKALFLGPPYSKLTLTSPVTATASDVKFTFSEELVFNIPLKPVVSLTGRMEMTRGPDGLITQYREYWDGGVGRVLSTVRLSGF